MAIGCDEVGECISSVVAMLVLVGVQELRESLTLEQHGHGLADPTGASDDADLGLCLHQNNGQREWRVGEQMVGVDPVV